jgi:hypothetical protein
LIGALDPDRIVYPAGIIGTGFEYGAVIVPENDDYLILALQ